MKKNEFISYRIKNIDTFGNNEDSKDITDVSPIRSFEIKISKIQNIKCFDKKNIKNLKIASEKEEDNFFNKLRKIKQGKQKLSSIKEIKKKSNFIYFSNIQSDKQINNVSKLFKEKGKKIDLKSKNKNILKKLKKFNSCKNLILGKYPMGHRLLLPIHHYFKEDKNHNNLREAFTIKRKTNKELYYIEENTEIQNNKERFKKEPKKNIKTEMKKEIQIENKIENNKDKKYNTKEKVEIEFKIKTHKKENKKEKPFTVLDKITRINEYNEKLKKMYSNRITKKSKERKNKEENIKGKTFEISQLNDFMDLNINFNRNPKNVLEKIEHKSVSHIFDIKSNDKTKQRYLEPIKNIINYNKEYNQENNTNINNNIYNENNINNKTDITNKKEKEEIKINKDNTEKKRKNRKKRYYRKYRKN